MSYVYGWNETLRERNWMILKWVMYMWIEMEERIEWFWKWVMDMDQMEGENWMSEMRALCMLYIYNG